MSVIKHFNMKDNAFQWDEVVPRELNVEGIAGVTKHILIGTDDDAPNSIMRFFWLEPGGHSRLETHPQEHEVIILTGKGTVQIRDTIHEVKQFDAVLVSPNELHQFKNASDEPFGFICVIPIPEHKK